MNRLRLEGEIIRDSLLAVSGRLNLTMVGPASFPGPRQIRLSAKDWKASADPTDQVPAACTSSQNATFVFLFGAFDCR